jgi:MFS family permease
MLRAMADRSFLEAMFLVGVPSKAVLTGVVMFALPMLLANLDFSHEEVGQIIMFYAVGVLLANFRVGRRRDRPHQAERYLFGGMLLSAAGLLLIGAIGLPFTAWLAGHPASLSTALLLGIAAVGIAHGFINAPVMTHVAGSAFAARVGATQAAATYRFMERIGHIAGPLIVGQLLAFGGHDPLIIGWVGLALLAFAVLFRVGQRRRPATCAEGS